MTAPTPAELIAFVREQKRESEKMRDYAATHSGRDMHLDSIRLFSALLRVLEGRIEHDDVTRIGQPDVRPDPQHAATDEKD